MNTWLALVWSRWISWTALPCRILAQQQSAEAGSRTAQAAAQQVLQQQARLNAQALQAQPSTRKR